MSDILGSSSAYRRVIVLTAALFVSYLTVAISLPAVPVFVVEGLHLSNALGGLAVGIGFLSTIVTRGYAGASADLVGGKRCMQRGLLIYAAAGAVSLVAGLPALHPMAALAVLVAGRLLLGLGESLAMVGMIGWALGMMGPARSGTVISLVGMGMYGAYAAGGPIGLALLHRVGFSGAMAACTLLPLLGLLAMQPLPAVPPIGGGQREAFIRVIGRIWRQGTVVGLQGVGFAAVGAFFTLYFISRGWAYAELGLTAFGVGFLLTRLVGGHLPDRLGGAPVAMVSLAVEAAGLFLLWMSPGPVPALAGTLLAGLGCSLVFPGMGAEVVKRVPPHLRSTAMGGFVVFQDLAYGLTGPLAGLLADRTGYAAIFLIAGLAAVVGLAVTATTMRPAVTAR